MITNLRRQDYKSSQYKLHHDSRPSKQLVHKHCEHEILFTAQGQLLSMIYPNATTKSNNIIAYNGTQLSQEPGSGTIICAKYLLGAFSSTEAFYRPGRMLLSLGGHNLHDIQSFLSAAVHFDPFCWWRKDHTCWVWSFGATSPASPRLLLALSCPGLIFGAHVTAVHN